MRLGHALLFVSIPCLVAGQELSLARVTAKNVNVRLGPGTAFPVLGGLAEDAAVVVCGRHGEWYRVYLPRDFHLYVNGKELSLNDKEGTCLRETAARLAPDRGHLAAGMLARDTKVKVVRQYGVWWAIEPPLSITGFMKEDFLEPSKALGKEEAERILGRPIVALAPVPSAPQKDDIPPKDPVSAEKGASEPSRPAPAVAREGEGSGVAPSANVGPARSAQPQVRIAVRTATENMRKIHAAFLAAQKGPVEKWDLTEVRNVCQGLLASPSATAEEKEFAQVTIDEVNYIERVQSLIIPKRTQPPPPETTDTKKGKDPLAVGWIRGQGRYIGRAGTHVLEKGNVAQFYLVGDHVDLDSCVNRLVSITEGGIEDLPPEFGCKLLRVKRVKVLSPLAE